MASSFIDVCRFNPTLGGTTDWTYSSAVTGYQSPTAAAAVNGAVYSYRAESADLLQWEVGYGAYNSGTGVFARTTVLFNSAGTTAKINFSTVPQIAIVALAEDLVFREKLIANRTYYVLTTGSDSNNGLTNTSGGAFLTIQKAIDTVAALDASTFNVVIQVGNGTYTASLVLKNFIGSGTCTLLGDTTTPSNVVIAATSGDAVQILNTTSAWAIAGFKITNSGGQCIGVRAKGILSITGKMEYGTTSGYHFYVANGGALTIGSNYTISGNAAQHIVVENASTLTAVSGLTITLTGTPAFATRFIYAQRNSTVIMYGETFSGAATGTRYVVASNSVIETNGGGATYFPGNAAGSTATGGQYL